MVMSIIAFVAIVGFGIYWIRSHKDEAQSIITEVLDKAKEIQADADKDVESAEQEVKADVAPATEVVADAPVQDVAPAEPVADAPVEAVAQDEVQK